MSPWPLLVTVCVFAGCAHFPVNDAIAEPVAGAPAPNVDYRYEATETGVGRPGLFVVLTLSGGGTRAAAFSYAVMKALDEKVPGLQGSLLDEVDVISSVSGGSFASAYYALHGKQMFERGEFDFEREFLRRDVEGALTWQLFSPWNWPALLSPWYDRVDMAAEYYDETIFKYATFADLAKSRAQRPFVFLNATDMALGARFEFTQDQFDLMHSDIATFPVARAVAASSAFPGLLSPVRLVNQPDQHQLDALRAGDRPAWPPRWIENAIKSEDYVRKRRGQNARSYLAMDAEAGEKQRRYIHLLDGGLADNIGLRGTLDGLVSTDPKYSLLGLFNKKQVDRVVIIVVDAKTRESTDWDQSSTAPGLLDVLLTTATLPMETYSAETTYLVSERLKQRRQTAKDRQLLRERIEQLNGQLGPADAPLWNVESNFIHLSFEDVADDSDRSALLALPTSFALDDKQVELVLRTVPQLLANSKSFQQLKTDLAKGEPAARE